MRPDLLLATISVCLMGLSCLPCCTLAASYHECDTSAECAKGQGQGTALQCTSDHLCVLGTPADKLCTRVYPQSPPPGAVPIGALLRLPSSGTGISDQLRLQSLQLGVDEINALSGSGQRSVVLHTCDVSAFAEDAPKAMKILIKDRKIVAAIGPSGSQAVIDVASLAGEAQVPLVAPSATAAAISALPQKGYIFRVAPSDNLQGPVLARLVPDSVGLALVFVDDAYGNGLQGAFLSAWSGRNAQNRVSATYSFAPSDSAKIALIAKDVVSLRPPYVVVIASADAATLLQQLAPLPTDPMDPAKSTQVLMTDGAKKSTLLNLLSVTPPLPQEHFLRVKGTAPTVSTGGSYLSFVSSFKGKYNLDPSADAFAAYAYDAFYAVVIALGSLTDTPTGPAVAAALRRISGTRASLAVGQSGYLDAVRKLRDLDGVTLEGTSGSIRFTANGDRDKVLFEVWSIDVKNKAFVSVPAT